MFSASLAVKDVRESMAFYEALNLTQAYGDLQPNWVIMQNGATLS